MKTIFVTLLLSIMVFGADNNYQNRLNNLNKNFFIENKGQWPPEVKYLARLGGMNAWITTTGITYDYYQINRNYNPQDLAQLRPDEREQKERENTSIKGHVVKMNFVEGSKSQSKVSDKQESYYNYFIGNDERKWASNVQLYGNVEEEGIYNQVNVKYYFDGNNLRYDYIVKPGADLEKLKVKFEGEEAIRVNDKGEIVLKTSLGEVINGKLYSYQNENGSKKEVECIFKLNSDNTVSFTAAN